MRDGTGFDQAAGGPGGRRGAGRTVMIGAAVTAGLLLLGLTGRALGGGAGADGNPVWVAGADSSATGSPSADAGGRVISVSATGDIILGDAPDSLPADDGEGFFDEVRDALAADLVMGNLEEPLTGDTGHVKCARPPSTGPDPSASPGRSSGCHQFRAPPGYAAHLRDAGFHLLNQANNHGNDFGPEGLRNTRRALAEHGLRHTGARDEIAVVEVRGVPVAVVGFAPSWWSNSLTDLDAARDLVERAADRADVVVVQVHMGAEGRDRTRVRPGTETFLGENRGDPIRFAHAVIDAGADLVVGHGPHVLRALEFHRGRLIAYSLGNFAGGGGTLSRSGALGWGGVLKVSLRPDGTYAGGQFISTVLDGAGRPTVDPRGRGLGLVDELCRQDFPTTGARLADDGTITTARDG